MPDKTPLYAEHLSASGKMVDFAGWSMPVNYGSQIEEHMAVRQSAGMFDVSHMTIIDVTGAQAEPFLQRLVANDVSRLAQLQALYGALLNARGGVIDDLIVYRIGDGFRCVVNASTRSKVLDWFTQHSPAGVVFQHKPQVMLAVQGPLAISKLAAVRDIPGLAELQHFYAYEHERWLIGRTGYTGEDGVEVMLPEADGVALWRDLLEVGVRPAGLGARDTLRLEAGLNLYGQDLDEAHTPISSNIAWTVALEPSDRDFIGRAAVAAEVANPTEKLTGILLQDKGVLRHGQTITTEHGTGVITSGSYSPSLQGSIGLARVPQAAKGECHVDIRGKYKSARLVRPPFMKNGSPRYKLDVNN